MKISNIRLINEDYEINDKKALHYYDTFQDLITNAENLEIGKPYQTLGFYEKKDGGEGLYIITDTENSSILQLEIATGIYANLVYNDKISIQAIGAKCNGVDDDSSYIKKAFNYGTPQFPNRKHIVINDTVICRGSQKIVDFNMCFLTTTNNSLMFQVNPLNATSALQNVAFKNAFVRLGQGGQFIKFHDCYFTELYNIRVQGLINNNVAIEYDNGFNHFAKSINIIATSQNETNVSGNHTTGILIKNQNSSIDQTYANMTNCTIQDTIFQHCEFGIKFESTVNVPWDTTKIMNIGSSYCDYTIYTYTKVNSTQVNNYAIDIDTIRAEFCGCAIYNNAFLSLGNIFCYHTRKPIYNEGQLCLYNNAHFVGLQGDSLIDTNTGILDFSGVKSLIRSNYVYGDITGRIIPSTYTTVQNVNNPSFDRLRTTVIPITQNFDFSRLNFLEGNGNVVIITGSGTIYNLPDSIPNIVLENNKAVKFVNRNGTLEIYN